MNTFIETGVPLTDIAKIMKTTATRVETEAHELDLYVGQDWAGRPAVSVIDAARMVSGDARRDADHAAAHGRWRAATEAWEGDREACRRTTYNDHFDAARRRGVGDPQAAAEAAQAASAGIVAFEKSTPQPVFADGTPSRLSMRNRVREAVVR